MHQDFRLGHWLVQPSLNTISRNGSNLRLEPKTMEVLVCLAQSGGEVASKEKLIAEVWPDTFVGDDALIRCVSGLRRALEDDAKSPRMIETIPKRGYRLLEKVERITPVEAARPQPKKKTKIVWGVAIAALVLAGASAAFFYSRKPLRLSEFGAVVLADFDNRTGDPVFDDTLRNALAAGLQQSPAWNIVSDQKIRDTLPLMGRSPHEQLNTETARELCQRLGSELILTGSIARMGTHFAVGLNAVNCATGDSLGREAIEVQSREQGLHALGGEIERLRQSLGESPSSIQRFSVPLDQVTTPSLDALKAFSNANIVRSEKGDRASLPFLNRAVELDPNFAMAHAKLATVYINLQESGLSTASATKAYALREKVSEPERYYIESHYYGIATGDLEKASQVYELWGRTYPRIGTPFVQLASTRGALAMYEEAISDSLEALRRDPHSYIAYTNLIGVYTNLSRFDDANATYQKMRAGQLDYPDVHVALYELASSRGDEAEMRRQVIWANGRAGVEDIILARQADTEAFHGRLGEAREFSRRAIESAQHAEKKETAALWNVYAALREGELGNWHAARQGAAVALALAPTREVLTVATSILARSGDASRAQKMSDDLARLYPVDTLINGYWLPTIRAAIKLAQSQPAEAIEALRGAVPYDLAAVSGSWTMALLPAYVRGAAYLRLRRGKEAAVEYQKFIDHRAAVKTFPLGALARLGLARAYSVQGESAKARIAYQEFLTLWKDADPDVPILREAKAEYEKLH